MQMPQISLDILIHVLSFLPAKRDLCDDSIATLTNCLQSFTLLREAALVSSIWKSHYQVRYTHSNNEAESTRCNKYRQCWRLMYVDRRQLDATAIHLLRKIVTDRKNRVDHANAIANLGLDVWDALDLVSREPVPGPFRRASVYDGLRTPKPHALPFVYWAQKLNEIIMKRLGYQLFCRARMNEISFEEMMTSLSCFFGVSPNTIRSKLDSLSEKCRSFLSNDCNITVSENTRDVMSACKGIFQFMLNEGFGPELRNEHHYRAILNHFPHAYLDTHKHTIPISLSHVFIAIATRLGLQAEPVNFPRVVLVHVRREHDVPLFINVFVDEASKCIVDWGTRHPFRDSGNSVARYLAPVGASPMLHRASLNIRGAASMTWPVDAALSGKALQVALCIHMLHGLDNEGALTMVASLVHPLDCASFFMDTVLPSVEQRFRDILVNHCSHVISEENKLALTRKERGTLCRIKHFVGMPLKHKKYGYLGFITGWDEVCEATEDWIEEMGVDKLDRGRHQPFYTVFAEDGLQRYVAEENIIPAQSLNDDMISELILHNPEFGIYFEDVVYENSSGLDRTRRGRFVLSPQSCMAYPDDEEKGNEWLSEGDAMQPEAINNYQ